MTLRTPPQHQNHKKTPTLPTERLRALVNSWGANAAAEQDPRLALIWDRCTEELVTVIRESGQ